MNAYSSPSVDAERLRMRTCSRQLRPAGTYYAARFSVSEEEELLCLRRLYSRDGDPLFLEELVLPKHSAERKRVPLPERGSLWKLPLPGVHTTRQSLELVELERRDLRILRLREERAALCLEREYLDSEGRVIALQRVLIPEGGEEELIVER
jgi:DNA-binding GntR family transcriptional regulator